MTAKYGFPRATVSRTVSGLTAIEETGCEKDNSDHEGEAGMKDVMQTQAEERVRKPRGEAQKPYPRCLLEHPHVSMLQGEVAAKVEQARFAGLVLH